MGECVNVSGGKSVCEFKWKWAWAWAWAARAWGWGGCCVVVVMMQKGTRRTRQARAQDCSGGEEGGWVAGW